MTVPDCEHGNPVGRLDSYTEYRCTECDRYGGKQLDLSDPEIREMAERNHTPHEIWRNDGQPYGIRCDTCGHEWPCPTVEALRALKGSA